MKVKALIGIAVAVLVACGGDGPTTPSAPVNINGVWDVSTTLNSGSGHGCLALFTPGQVVTSVASIQQTGSVVTIYVVDGSGVASIYAGSLNDGQFSVFVSGTQPFVRMACRDGDFDVQLASHPLTGTATSALITAAATQTTNVYEIPPAPSSQTGQLVAGSYRINTTIRMTKR